MATSQTSLLAFLSNDADFRSWGGGVSAAIQAVGLTQTADTGQINWATVTRPGTTSTAAGYEVYQFSDALQASAPVFIKVEYGAAGTVDRPSLWVTTGSGSNGSGTLTGQVTNRWQVSPSASSTGGTLRPWYFSGASNRLVFAGNLTNAAASGMYASVERPKDGAGADTADGVSATVISGGSSNLTVTIPASGTVPSALNTTPWVDPRSGQTNNGTNIVFVPSLHVAAGRLMFGMNALAFLQADVAGPTPLSVSIFGASRTYLPLSGYALNAPGGITLSTTSSLALLWE